MSKYDDDKLDAAMKPVVAPASRNRRIPATVDDDGLATIERAVTLKLATLCILGKITPEIFGEALTSIAREWVNTEMGHLSGADKDD